MSEWIGRGRLVHIYLDEMDRIYFQVADRAQTALEEHWNAAPEVTP